mgnify:CR=1 FL=1
MAEGWLFWMEYMRNKLDNLFIANPMIINKKRKYIWISKDKNDIEGMVYSLNYCIAHDIYINGFAAECTSIIGITILNKEVYDVHQVTAEDSLILTENENSKYYCPIEILNPKIIGSDIVVWGAGNNGEFIADYFNKKNIRISFFVDSDQNKIGKKIRGNMVYGIEKVESLSVETSLIEASDQYAEIDKIVRDLAPHIDCYVCHHVNSGKYFDPANLMYLREVIKDRDVYIYGYGYRAQRVRKCIELLDFRFAGFLIGEDQCDKAYKEHEKWMFPEEILYYSNRFIIIVSDEKELAVNTLLSLGLQYSVDFSPIEIISYNLLYARKNIIDTNLGHTYQRTAGMNGMDIYGMDQPNSYKIVVLGGSTTDGTLFPFRSWPEILYEQIHNDKIVIYNAGVSGYTSAQELIKLIRDIVPMKPNVVIVYDGYNDTSEINARPGQYFEFIYLKRALDFAKKHMNHNWDFIAQNEEQNKGMFSIMDNFENWLLNIEMMHAIAEDRGIKFYSFFQPMLSSKKTLTSNEKGILFEAENFQGLRETVLRGRNFRHKIQDAVKAHTYIYDLSDLFDLNDDVYMDICHVREDANRVIAEEVLTRIELPF